MNNRQKTAMSCVKTVTHTLQSPISAPVELIATVPTDLENCKTPISLVLGFKSDEAEQPTTLMSYHYALPYHKTQQVVGTPLLDTNNDWVRDLTRQLATLICKKLNRPCYVAWSNAVGQQGTPDQLFVIKHCIDFLAKVIV